MSVRRAMLGISNGEPIENNVFIGGVSSIISTASLLAGKLKQYPSGSDFLEADVVNFTIIGDNIECYINVDYSVRAFNGFGSVSLLTYYQDYGGFCKYHFGGAFSNVVNCKELHFINVVKVEKNTGNWSYQTNAIEIMYFPNCLNWGDTAGYESDMFRNNFLGVCNLYVNPLMETINLGGVEGDLAYAKNLNSSSTISYVTNTTPPNNITDLSALNIYSTIIEIGWSAPTSTNTIKEYRIYVDSTYYGSTVNLNFFISNLTNLGTYNIKVQAVDILENQSFSSVLNATVNGTAITIPLANIVSEWKMQDNVLDTVGSNDGTATAISYVTAGVGKAADFDGATSKIDVADASNLSFTNGVTDSAFSISFLVNFSSIVNAVFIGKENATNGEWRIFYVASSNVVRVELYSAGTSANKKREEIIFEPEIDTTYSIITSYAGGTSRPNISIQGVAKNGTQTIIGTYSSMINTTAFLRIGKGGFSESPSTFAIDGWMDCVRLWDTNLTPLVIAKISEQERLGNDINP